MKKIAVLVDGGFFKKRAEVIYGHLTPRELSEKLIQQCYDHVTHKDKKRTDRELYRIFYYDCPPLDKKVKHPLTQEMIDFSKSEASIEAAEFLSILRNTRKVALRLGKLAGSGSDYILPSYNVRKMIDGRLTIENMKPSDLKLEMRQKGVDMRIGLDIASLAYKQQVDEIVLIAGDSDFVPAAKLARREGLEFILDPMWNQISEDLLEHIDGKFCNCDKPSNLIKREQQRATDNFNPDKKVQAVDEKHQAALNLKGMRRAVAEFDYREELNSYLDEKYLNV